MADEIVGFTGSRAVSDRMRRFIDGVLDALDTDTDSVVTGGCVGVDAYVARAASTRGLLVFTVLPANMDQADPEWDLYCDEASHMPAGTTYKDRNAMLVHLSERMVGVPAYGEHHPKSKRSGTWQTIRLCRKAGKPIDVLNQEGID